MESNERKGGPPLLPQHSGPLEILLRPSPPGARAHTHTHTRREGRECYLEVNGAGLAAAGRKPPSPARSPGTEAWSVQPRDQRDPDPGLVWVPAASSVQRALAQALPKVPLLRTLPPRPASGARAPGLHGWVSVENRKPEAVSNQVSTPASPPSRSRRWGSEAGWEASGGFGVRALRVLLLDPPHFQSLGQSSCSRFPAWHKGSPRGCRRGHAIGASTRRARVHAQHLHTWAQHSHTSVRRT